MEIGIDGNHWFVSDGGCLGSATACFTFGRVLDTALRQFREDHPDKYSAQTAARYEAYRTMTPEQFHQHDK